MGEGGGGGEVSGEGGMEEGGGWVGREAGKGMRVV